MLLNLYIKNFILIDEINLELSDQFNVFTGETGAGKSLFVDALNFVSGQRSSSSVVGNKGESSYVEAVFSFKNNIQAINLLKDFGLYDENDDNVVFSREMHRNGRSTARINRRIVNLKSIREIMALVVDIHSQHDTQYLLDDKNHLNLLQLYVHNEELLNEYKIEFDKYHQKLEEIEKLKENKLSEDELEFSKFLLKEIHELDPSIEDYEALDERLKLLENFESTKLEYQEIENVLTHQENVLGSLYHLLPIFEKIDNLNEQFKDVYYQLEDISTEISHLNNNFIFDEHEFRTLNNRMLNYTQLIRKYGDISQLIDKKLELEDNINNADYFDDLLVDLNNELKEIEENLMIKANALSNLRKEKAKELEKAIVKELFDLNLENAVFKIDFQKKEYSSDGMDDVKFMVSMNKGMDVAYLSKVASGGELSRVMLGLKVVFGDIQSINTLIFDEIDTGVSGVVALKIGEKMRTIAQSKQVISITHLPAVAVCGDNHYLISKKDAEDTTITSVDLIENKERIEHLAIMMSGNLNQDSIQAAETLLEQGRE